MDHKRKGFGEAMKALLGMSALSEPLVNAPLTNTKRRNLHPREWRRAPKNKLIIVWNWNSIGKGKGVIDSFHSMSEEKARKVFSKRNSRSMRSATWYGDDRQPIDILNTRLQHES